MVGSLTLTTLARPKRPECTGYTIDTWTCATACPPLCEERSLLRMCACRREKLNAHISHVAICSAARRDDARNWCAADRWSSSPQRGRPGPARWRARGACSHPACEHRVIRTARSDRSSYGSCSPYVEQSFARVVSPSPSCYQGNTSHKEAISSSLHSLNQVGQLTGDVPSYLDFRPWGIFSTGTHAAARNLATPPIEALMSRRRPMYVHLHPYVCTCARTRLCTGCIMELHRRLILLESRRTLEECVNKAAQLISYQCVCEYRNNVAPQKKFNIVSIKWINDISLILNIKSTVISTFYI